MWLKHIIDICHAWMKYMAMMFVVLFATSQPFVPQKILVPCEQQEWRQATPLQVFQPARARTPAACPCQRNPPQSLSLRRSQSQMCRIHPQMIGLVTPRWMRWNPSEGLSTPGQIPRKNLRSSNPTTLPMTSTQAIWRRSWGKWRTTSNSSKQSWSKGVRTVDFRNLQDLQAAVASGTG